MHRAVRRPPDREEEGRLAESTLCSEETYLRMKTVQRLLDAGEVNIAYRGNVWGCKETHCAQKRREERHPSDGRELVSSRLSSCLYCVRTVVRVRWDE